MKKTSFNYSKLISLLLVVSMLLSFIPTNFVRAEDSYPAYQMVDVGGSKQLEFHNSVVDIPLEDAISLLGIDDVSKALLRIKDGDNVIWTTANLDIGSGSVSNNLVLEAGKTYVIEQGELKMPSWKPSTWYTEWTESSRFTTKIYDVLTVESNQANVVFVDGTPIDAQSNFKVYRGSSVTIDVTMGSLLNNTVSLTVDGEKVLTDVGSYVIEYMAKDMKAEAVYVEDTESAIELDTTASNNADYTFVPTAQPGTEVAVTISPKPGYHVTSVAIMNGDEAVATTVEYVNGIAAVKFTTGEHKAVYKVKCETAATVVLNGNLVINYNDKLSSDDVKQAIINCIDKENSAPIFPDKTDMLIEYNAANINADTAPQWKPVDFAPGTLEQLALHKFGNGRDSEKVRITYTGDGKQYGAGVITFTVSLVDNRKETAVIDAVDSVKVTYGEFTKEYLMALYMDGGKGVYDSDTLEAITDGTVSFAIDPTKLIAGEHEITIKFSGNAFYKETSKTVKLVIEKAPVDLDVTSKTLAPNNGKVLSDVITISNKKANYVAAAIALDAVNGSAVAHVDISGFIADNETLMNFIKSALGDKTSADLTIDEFKTLIGLMGNVDSSVDTAYLEKFIDLLTQVQELEGVGEVKLNVTITGDISFDNAGIYMIGAMVTDINYTMDMDMGYVVVVPETIKAELSFNEEIANLISVDAVKGGVYDFGVTAKVNGEISDAAASKLHNVFFGLTATGDPYVENTMSQVAGAYTQIAYIQDFGNTMYYAKPIIRAMAVTPELVDVKFVDAEGNEITDWDFVYNGKPVDVSVSVVAKQTRASLSDEFLTVRFFGIDAGGKTYDSDKAPVNAGAYTVVAVYLDEANEVVGTNMKAFVVKKTESGFSAADKTVVFDGNKHNIDVVNPNNMYLAHFVVDSANKLNLIVPERLFDGTASITKDEAVKMIKDFINEKDIKILIDAETLAELKDYINNMENYELVINGEEPSEIGTYKVFALAVGKNYQTTVDEATLTIECDHSKLGDWETNEEKHWKTCECGVKVQEDEHKYEDGKCVCGKEEPECKHENVGEWEHDDTKHWKTCECGAKVSEGEHEYTDGKCECGMEEPECKHENLSDWKSDDEKHWKECECGVKVQEGAHSYTDGKCECGKEEPKDPVKPECDHTKVGDWKYDDAKHWKECECGVKVQEGEHKYTDGKCECGKVEPCKHEDLGKWETDANKHWKTCKCGEKVQEGKHDFKDGKCSVCGLKDADPDDTETPKLGYEGFNPTILFLLMAFSAVGLATGTFMYVHPFKKNGGKYLKKD